MMDNDRVSVLRLGFCLAVLVWAAWPAPTMAAPPLQAGELVHMIQAGETLFGIARQYGVTVEAVVAVNGLLDPDQIQVGQRLIIPSAITGVGATAVYVVQPGDTLTFIARRYNTTSEQVAELNHLANPNLITIGQALLVPAVGDGTGSAESGGQVYVVQFGDTMAQIAARYNTTVWAIAQVNGIANPNVVHAGQRLVVPVQAGESSLPLPFVAIQILPAVAVQGQTVQIVVETKGEAILDGSYNEQPLMFVGQAGHYRTLIGVHAMAAPGPYALALKAIQGDKQVSVRNMVQVVQGYFGVQYLAFTDEKAQLLAPQVVQQEAQRVWEVTTQATLPQRWQGAFGLPLAGDPAVTTPFGMRRSYGTGSALSAHGGVDYAAAQDAPVYSPAAGRVVLAEGLQVRGNAVIVDHGRGVMSGYWHLSQINVVAGQEVARGELLGLVGSTGLSTGAHLHWEMRVMGVPVDPMQWMQQSFD